MRLTDRTVAGLALATGKGDRIHFDADLAGFGYRLRRGAGGRMLRSWVVQYRHAGIVRRYLIGPAKAIGAEQAPRASSWPRLPWGKTRRRIEAFAEVATV